LTIVKFSRAELEAFRGATIPDVLGPDVRLLIVGINPGLRSAAVGASFANRGNRFWAALHRAGITDHVVDTSEGFAQADLDLLAERHLGMTTLVRRATARADELTAAELVAGRADLANRVAGIRPRVVAMLGITAYRVAFERPKALIGLQPDRIAGVPLWVVPNPSGLNAHATVDGLAVAYREVAAVAGIPLDPRPDPSSSEA
jgi:double-stranded uracil-DNA glycosylase